MRDDDDDERAWSVVRARLILVLVVVGLLVAFAIMLIARGH